MDTYRLKMEFGGVLLWTWIIATFLMQLAQFVVLQALVRSLAVY